MIVNGQEVVLNKMRTMPIGDYTAGCVKYKHYVSEADPCIRTLKMWVEKIGHGVVELALPYTQYHWCEYCDIQIIGVNTVILNTITFSNTPIKDVDSPVYFPPLPHIRYDNICGTINHPTVSQIIADFWQSRFSASGGYEGVQYLKKQQAFTTYQEWEHITKVNPAAILHTDWHMQSQYMKHLAKRLENDRLKKYSAQ